MSVMADFSDGGDGNLITVTAIAIVLVLAAITAARCRRRISTHAAMRMQSARVRAQPELSTRRLSCIRRGRGRPSHTCRIAKQAATAAAAAVAAAAGSNAGGWQPIGII